MASMAESDAKNLTALVSAREHCEHKINMRLHLINLAICKLGKLSEMYQNDSAAGGIPESIALSILLFIDNATTIKKRVEFWNMPSNFTRVIVVNNIAEGVVILDNAIAMQTSMCEMCDEAIRNSPFSIDHP
jgi:hypothetical protein